VNAPQTILFVDQTGELGGAELCLADLAIHLRERCSVLLFQSGPFERLLKRNDVPTITLAANSANPKVSKSSGFAAYLRAFPAFVSLVIRVVKAARHFDLLYANTPKAIVVTAFVASILRKPFLVHLHDITDASHFSRTNRWLLVLVARFAAGVIANSTATAEAFQKAGGKSKNLKVVPNGFCVQRFRSDQPDKHEPPNAPAEPDQTPNAKRSGRAGPNAKRRTPHAKRQTPLVGMFGRITPWKGQKILIQALAKLPNLTAVIVGDALFTEEDRRYKQELVELAERLGLAARVQFAGFQPDILPFLKAVDVVVHCSVSPEPFGRVIVEAILAGKPVIAARAGAPLEIIQHGVTGLLVAPGDTEELVRAIEQLLDNRSWAESLATQGRELATQRYALETVLAEWVGFIDQIEGGLPGSRRQTSCDWAAKSTVTGA
jgi:glycosyltransferase involved in cell wall biosynthesis